MTLLSKITFKRAYYQCCLPTDQQAREQGEEAEANHAPPGTHGEAPADAKWGLHAQRTTAGVQQAISYLCATSTLEEAAKNFSRLLPLETSARQALNLLQPVGRALQEQEGQRKGDVYREVKVGAVFAASHGPHRSRLASGVFVDQAERKHYVVRRSTADDFGKLLYTLAVTHGLQQAKQLVALGDGAAWLW